MVTSRSIAPALGVIAILTTIPTLTFIVSFAIILRREKLSMSIPGFVGFVLGVLCLMSMTVLVYQHLRDHNRKLEIETRRMRWERLPEMAGLLCLLCAVVSVSTLAWMQIQLAVLPAITLGASTQSLLLGTFVLWGVSSLAQAVFLINISIVRRRITQQTQSLHTEEEPHNSSEMQQTSRPQTAPPPSRGRESTDAPSFSSNKRKRSASDNMTSIRSSITQVVRPIASKTRLISQKTSYRPTSLDSGTGEREIIEDGFDSWDTSAVDPQSRHFVMSTANSTNSSPIRCRFLETIPASPTASRSPSPGFPLDLEMPSAINQKRRSRSHSPCISSKDACRSSPAVSPATSEAHIHPLFRTDSLTPPPSATPGTVVTAAPGAGQVISDRRSLHRMRSGSLPSSPLGHSSSMDDIAKVTREEDDSSSSRSPSPPEREMTPPIPDWILGAGPRISLSGYTRRKGFGGLVAVGEARES